MSSSNEPLDGHTASTSPLRQRICVLVGSGRPGGNSFGIVEWVRLLLLHHIPNAEVIVVRPNSAPHPSVAAVTSSYIPAEIKDPSLYATAEERQWSAFIRSCVAIVVVTPQYNWGYPSTVKAAFDILFWEWKELAAMIVTYGGHGGGKCGEQLRTVMGGGMRMAKMVETKVEITLPEEYIRGKSRVLPEDVSASLSLLSSPKDISPVSVEALKIAHLRSALFLGEYVSQLTAAIEELKKIIKK